MSLHGRHRRLRRKSKKTRGTLTSAKRRRLKTSSFAIPSRRAYPIHDISHARNALARVAQHGTPAEKSQVRRAVRARYPSIGG